MPPLPSIVFKLEGLKVVVVPGNHLSMNSIIEIEVSLSRILSQSFPHSRTWHLGLAAYRFQLPNCLNWEPQSIWSERIYNSPVDCTQNCSILYYLPWENPARQSFVWQICIVYDRPSAAWLTVMAGTCLDVWFWLESNMLFLSSDWSLSHAL